MVSPVARLAIAARALRAIVLARLTLALPALLLLP
jgi:hypothetical protein